MKLFFSPGACSMSPHIVAQELGIPLTLVKVDTQTNTTAYAAIRGVGVLQSTDTV